MVFLLNFHAVKWSIIPIFCSLKTRQGLNNVILSTLFERERHYIAEVFQTVLIMYHTVSNDIPKFWTSKNPTEDEKRRIFDYFNEGIDVLHEELRQRFRDPENPGQEPVFLLIGNKRLNLL